ncbi:hypothetical protein HMPREF9244_00958 [Alloscardovia omnicolens F0580]|uniref:Uncharacterized protein n=1 Tax=Alloscardovia omnicolens F0580 TaxID=1321816 RepID=U1SEV2_9BIFI|nr:hypothetical protein HMPREF9244_00958 [Alloscardovia omnicolens F0580]
MWAISDSYKTSLTKMIDAPKNMMTTNEFHLEQYLLRIEKSLNL